ncbi:MAG: hypothetical protein R3C44_19345 [Chloroflexota bacterium]
MLGIIYRWLFIYSEPLFNRIFGQHATTAMFIVAIVLMLAIEFLLDGYGGIWLISMPVVAMAVH